MGGDTPEREVSLRSGAGIGRALIELGHRVTLLDTGTGKILASPDVAQALGSEPPASLLGHGPATPQAGGASVPPAALAVPGAGSGNLEIYAKSIPRSADLVFIALHGGDGENGVLQAVLDLARIPYTGSGVLSSSVSMDKSLSKRIFRDLGIPTPEWVELQRQALDANAPLRDEDLRRLGGFPLIVKPNDQGSSVGISVARNPRELLSGVEEASRYSPIILVESYIEGREITVAVLDDRAYPAVEIIPEGGFYDYQHKYTAGASRYEAPARLTPEERARVERLAHDAYRALRCSGIARVDFRLAEDGTPYCLEVNTVPGMTETSLVPKAAAAAGQGYRDLVRAIVESAPARAARSPASPA